MRSAVSIVFAVLLLGGSAQAHPRRLGTRSFQATAFTDRGTTKSGTRAQRGVVAADTRILPIGTEIRVSNAGPLSGTYVVADTGSRVAGRHIDIFVPNRLRARRFGKKTVRVKVLRWGDGAI
jgi:3D (Asp-Asp-Asp) domain-containing protein